VTQVLYRAPYSDHWETRTLDWALDQIARRTKAARDEDFTVRNESGRLLNSVRSIGTLGGATIDNEENYLIKKLFGGGLGVVSIENQARI
jgi:formate dehydrogenase major subunit